MTLGPGWIKITLSICLAHVHLSPRYFIVAENGNTNVMLKGKALMFTRSQNRKTIPELYHLTSATTDADCEPEAITHATYISEADLKHIIL